MMARPLLFSADQPFPLLNNMTEALVNLTVIKHDQTKHENKVNFSVAVHICRVFLRLATEKDP